MIYKNAVFIIFVMLFAAMRDSAVSAQIGKRFPSEKIVKKDPVTGTILTFLTSTSAGDSKIYQTHNQWTSDGKWLIFRSALLTTWSKSTIRSIAGSRLLQKSWRSWPSPSGCT